MSEVDSEYLAFLAWPVIAALAGWLLALLALNFDFVLDQWSKRRHEGFDR
jgi:hypothetical protein